MRIRATPSATVVCTAMLIARCGGSATPEGGTGQPPFNPVATVDEVMDAIVTPSSQAIFDAVVYSNGELVQAPKSDNDWFTLRIHALGVAEAGNLLMMAPRAKDDGDWMTLSRGLNDRAMAVAAAAERKDVDRLLNAGGDLYSSCEACHDKYVTTP